MQPAPATRFQAGDHVVLISTGECGVVVHSWKSHELAGEEDCYVAFSGDRFPNADEPPSQGPYLLRYAAMCLQRG